MKILITGTAGFIGHALALRLLDRGDEIIGVDNLNDYYDVTLKQDRLSHLLPHANFTDVRLDLEDADGMAKLFAEHKPQRVVNLAAQAGVRYSLENPQAYIDANISGVLGMPRNSVPPMGRLHLLLSDRHDFAQHFLVSAGLTVSSGTGIADSIGLLKELDDSQGGSGFSFTDIGADRTGVRFAELAVSDTNKARAVQDRFSFGLAEAELMAEFRDLPEFLDSDTFQRLYGGVGTPAYNRVIDDIENRISSTRFFSEMDR